MLLKLAVGLWSLDSSCREANGAAIVEVFLAVGSTVDGAEITQTINLIIDLDELHICCPRGN